MLLYFGAFSPRRRETLIRRQVDRIVQTDLPPPKLKAMEVMSANYNASNMTAIF